MFRPTERSLTHRNAQRCIHPPRSRTTASQLMQVYGPKCVSLVSFRVQQQEAKPSLVRVSTEPSITEVEKVYEVSHVILMSGMCFVTQLTVPWLANLGVLKNGSGSRASRACVAQWQSICLVNRRSPVQSRAEARYCHAASMVVELERRLHRSSVLLVALVSRLDDVSLRRCWIHYRKTDRDGPSCVIEPAFRDTSMSMCWYAWVYDASSHRKLNHISKRA